jgi:two-component system, NarL family, response regulator YdfI
VIRVLVVSASGAARRRLEAVIQAHRSLELAGGSGTLAGLSRDIEDLQPDVVLVQTGDPEHDAPAAVEAASGGGVRFRSPAVVVLADIQESTPWAYVVRSGVAGLLPAEATASEIGAAIESAAAGLVVVHPAFLDSPTETEVELRTPAESPKPSLTPREIEVLNLMAQGLGNKEIAWRLGISEHTAKFHIGSIFNKLDASGRTEAVTLGIRAGLIML